MTIKVFAYLRVSTKGQLEGDGFPRQREAVTRFASANGYEIERIFEEQGVSGKTDLEDRDALQEMLTAMEENGYIKYVLIERLDRLARDLMVQEQIIADFRKRGFEIISTVEPDLCSDDPTRKLMRQIMGAIAEYDRAMIVAKLRVARNRRKQQTGRCEGVKPFGVLPGEENALDFIRLLRKNGHTYTGIAERLDAEGFKPRHGDKWNPLVVGRIIRAQKTLAIGA